MGRTGVQLTEEKRLFAALWEFTKAYTGAKTDAEWRAVIDGADEFFKGFEGGSCEKLARDMLLAVIDHISKK